MYSTCFTQFEVAYKDDDCEFELYTCSDKVKTISGALKEFRKAQPQYFEIYSVTAYPPSEKKDAMLEL